MPWLAPLALALAFGAPTAAGADDGDAVDFARKIRPILSRNCFACHGPDKEHRKAGLRLDTRDGAFADRDGTVAFVAGKPEKSDAYLRMIAKDPDDLMPPPKSGKKLTSDELALVRTWIAQGAKWQDHWSFVAPVRPVIPASRWPAAVKNPIDAFVHAELPAAGLAPAPAADPRTLLRRVALDLTGLPPAPEDVEAFAAAPTDAAYEKLVDRYLADPAYGERWARVWLDLARYADSRGYEKDFKRTIWRWRDWVIDAYNRDLPYPQFTIEQLAGDLLPAPTESQLLATAFHRNTLTNDEGGTDDEEFRVAAVKDRIDTTMQVWMGLTAGCAKCHDHKYDPITLAEYYRLYAFFDQTEDADRADDGPVRAFPTEPQRRALADADREIAPVDRALDARARRHRAALSRFERDWLAVHAGALAAPDGARPTPAVRGEWYRLGPIPVTVGQIPYEFPFAVEGRTFDPQEVFDGQYRWEKQSSIDGSIKELGDKGRSVTYLARTLEVNSARTLRVAFHADEVARAWLDGKPLFERRTSAEVTLELAPGKHTILFKAGNNGGPQQVMFRFVAEEAGGLPFDVARALLQPAQRRDKVERDAIRDHFLRAFDAAAVPDLRRIDELRRKRKDIENDFPRIPILQELAAGQRRDTRVHVRGDFMTKGDAVTPGTPAFFLPLPAPPGGARATRLDLARWLVDPRNPLTARVAVNRLWAQLFGAGLVETEEDFGAQGTPPSHPELLDYLATEYVAGGWSQKRLLRLLVTSATYRQSSRATPDHLEKDRFNRLLARGPRFRMEAEMVRDAALAAVGLLTRKVGGPSVMPPQPDKIWQTVYSDVKWVAATDGDRFRRGLYTFHRRSAPYPSFMIFDGSAREVCTPRRIRTNTPLQALVTLNDPVYVEAAQALARRARAEGAADRDGALRRAFAAVLLRAPTAAELRPLAELYDKRRAFYARHLAEARALAESPLLPLPADADVAELAALVAVGNVLLSTDEFLTKG